MLKHCPRCNKDLPLSEFHKDASRASGLFNRCKSCSTADRKKRAERAGHVGGQWTANDPLRANARNRSKHAVLRGKLKEEPCFICGEKAEIHHPFYGDHLLVTWLCKSHHAKLHAEHRAYNRPEYRCAAGHKVRLERLNGAECRRCRIQMKAHALRATPTPEAS